VERWKWGRVILSLGYYIQHEERAVFVIFSVTIDTVVSR